MKSWKNRRNTYWIFIATIFGLILPGNQTNHYKNYIGLIFCWGLYLFCFIRNNQEVEEQEQREEEEYQKRVKWELEKKEKEKIKKEKRDKEFYRLVECPKIIDCIMVKYNKDWEQDLYPSDARYHINDIKKHIKADIEYEEKEIRNYKNAIKRIQDLKKETRFHYKCEELDRKIKTYQSIIIRCQEHIETILKKQEWQVVFYQNQIEQYKDKCRQLEQEADQLLQNSPEKIVKAINYYIKEIEKNEQKFLKGNYDSKSTWIKHEEEKLIYLSQARLDAINRIKEMKGKKKQNEN